jgi:hypothetical protein
MALLESCKTVLADSFYSTLGHFYTKSDRGYHFSKKSDLPYTFCRKKCRFLIMSKSVLASLPQAGELSNLYNITGMNW